MKYTAFSTIAILSVLVLGGCSSGSGSSTTGQNTDVCNQFGAAYNDFVKVVKAGPTDAANVGAWTAAKKADLDKITALPPTAKDTVKNDLTKLVTSLPADSLSLSTPGDPSGQALVDNSAAVGNSCSADGTSLQLSEFPVVKFNN